MDLSTLGDLTPFIWLFKAYERMEDVSKKNFHRKYSVSEKEMSMILSKKEAISL